MIQVDMPFCSDSRNAGLPTVDRDEELPRSPLPFAFTKLRVMLAPYQVLPELWYHRESALPPAAQSVRRLGSCCCMRQA